MFVKDVKLRLNLFTWFRKLLILGMQSKWFTYGFLLFMNAALITLAVLQYRWLGSVSEAEQERLEEGLVASGENFASDFNEVFSDLKGTFRIQVTEYDADVTPMIQESYVRWNENARHPEVLSELHFVRFSDTENPSFYRFDGEESGFQSTIPDSALVKWLDENHNPKPGVKPSVSLRSLPDFGTDTYIEIPIQILDFITVTNEESIGNLNLQLSIDQLNDVILLKISNDYVRSTLIPEIAATYFGDSFFEQYHLALVKSGENPFVYFNSDPGIMPDNPDLKTDLDRLNLSSMIFLDQRPEVENISIQRADSISISYFESSTTTNTESGGRFKHVYREESNVRGNLPSDLDTPSVFGFRNSAATFDTSVTSAFVANITTAGWELWLSFKAGSLEEFVAKTRNRNLTISFGILLILGISSVLIVVFAQRSRDLAAQQMLFVAGVSHELRTPLSVIRSAAENLSEGVVQDKHRQKEYAKLMLKEGRRLSDMVDQIMEFSGIQTGKRIYNFTDVDIEQLMIQIKEEFHPILEDEGLTLEYSSIAKLNTIKADRDALFLSISNLIHNAIKFSNGSSRLILRVDDISYKSGLGLRIQVQDFGVGIPQDEQSDVFKPFYRARKSVENQVKGNGIGLSLVSKVAKAHQGEIRLTSSVGEGSTFSLIIPFHP